MDERIKRAFARGLRLKKDEAEKLSDSSSVNNVSVWDSLGHMSLILAFETEFGISIAPLEAIELSNIVQIKKMLSKKGIQVT